MVRLRTAIQMLTMLSMVFFLMSVFFELEVWIALTCSCKSYAINGKLMLQYQHDDGTCELHDTESSCRKEKSIFDTSVSKCGWHVREGGSEICRYNHVKISVQVRK
jgi:hypothetical protein